MRTQKTHADNKNGLCSAHYWKFLQESCEFHGRGAGCGYFVIVYFYSRVEVASNTYVILSCVIITMLCVTQSENTGDSRIYRKNVLCSSAYFNIFFVTITYTYHFEQPVFPSSLITFDLYSDRFKPESNNNNNNNSNDSTEMKNSYS